MSLQELNFVAVCCVLYMEIVKTCEMYDSVKLVLSFPSKSRVSVQGNFLDVTSWSRDSCNLLILCSLHVKSYTC